MDIKTTSPRRFRFGLRTLFVVVTLVAMVCAWVSYSLNWIQERQAAGFPGWYDSRSPHPPRAPGGLWLFGEKGRDRIHLVEGFDDIEQMRRLFPEARIDVVRRYQRTQP